MYKTAKSITASTGITQQAQNVIVIAAASPGATTLVGFDGQPFTFTPAANTMTTLDISIRGGITLGSNVTLILKG